MNESLPILPTRRSLLKLGTLFTGASWLNSIASFANASEGRSHKSIIMLWLEGGPATIDLWDLKPGHEHGGPFRPIQSAVPGIQISEHLPGLAARMRDIALLRSMTSPEGDHERAMHLARTGYRPAGAIQFPALGAIASAELGSYSADLPNFVTVTPTRRMEEVSSGFLSADHAPLQVTANGNGGKLQVAGLISQDDAEKRIASKHSLLQAFDMDFAASAPSEVANSIISARTRATRLLRPTAASVFDLETESAEVRDRYGRNTFGQGCLLARRLVSQGVPFVEVTLGGWDAHRNNFETVRQMSARVDTAISSLLDDLRESGLLDSTLLVCHGEFGRTPRINGNQGRDHWPHAWSAMLAGGSIQGGQVIGATSHDGMEVTDRPLKVPDLIATACQIVGIDARKQNMSNVRRPIRVADVEAQPITELL